MGEGNRGEYHEAHEGAEKGTRKREEVYGRGALVKFSVPLFVGWIQRFHIAGQGYAVVLEHLFEGACAVQESGALVEAGEAVEGEGVAPVTCFVWVGLAGGGLELGIDRADLGVEVGP